MLNPVPAVWVLGDPVLPGETPFVNDSPGRIATNCVAVAGFTVMFGVEYEVNTEA